MENIQLQKLVTCIEENLRASKLAGLSFVDPSNFKTRLLARQNHVIFGRRGAGKSSLLASLNQAEGITALALNLEDYKDISFPNIILHVLAESFEQLGSKLLRQAPLRKKVAAFRLARQLRKKAKSLRAALNDPDRGEEQTRRRVMQEGGAEAGGGTRLPFSFSSRRGIESETARRVDVDKLGSLRTKLPEYKTLFVRAAEVIGNKPIFLALDDFYFVPKSVQADFVDFFHRLTKGTHLFLKIGTIKHRSSLYKQTSDSYIGVELGHDAFEIDMDYTLDNFLDLQNFMRKLLTNAVQQSGAEIADVDQFFSGEGFVQLCLASGGVPRDFLSLFVRLATRIISGSINSIGKISVNEAAIANLSNKIDSLKTDSAEEREVLEHYLYGIKSLIYNTKRTNTFLVAKPELEKYPHERQAIRELIDLRLLHLVEANTSSAPSDGRRYEAYMMDVSLYDNSRPMSFTQIEPGTSDSKSRKDDLRAAPRISLRDLRENFLTSGIQAELQVTEA